MTARAFGVAMVGLIVAISCSGPAIGSEGFDPSRAAAEVQAARLDKTLTFCSAPIKPLTMEARALCPHAHEISGCEGFAAACAKQPEEPPSWLMRILRALAGAAGTPFANIVVWIVIAAAVGAVLLPVVLALVRMRRDRALAGTHPDADGPTESADDTLTEASTDEEELLLRAQQLTGRGELTSALQVYLAASLRALDKRGAVRIARERTNGEYVRLCTDPAARGSLREITRQVDRAQFGREEPSPDAVRRVRERAEAIVRMSPVLMLVVASLVLLGCDPQGGFWATRSNANDPAGDALFLELLRRQGATVEPLGLSLASLPLAEASQTDAAVVVDVARTDWDDETRAHIASWVQAGGVLVLAGPVHAWPKEFGVTPATTTKPAELTVARTRRSKRAEHASLANGHGLNSPEEAEVVASFSDDVGYAVLLRRGAGGVVGFASDELFTNAGLARAGNAAALVAILARSDRFAFKVAQPEDGMTPPSSPLAVLTRAGLGLGLGHAFAAVLVVFLAAGTRLARPRAAAPPRRRAFAEHVRAVGALYARTSNSAHALHAYSRFVVERVRPRMPRGTTDIAAFLASRSRFPVDVCRKVWARATGTEDGTSVRDDLTTLKELGTIYASATARDK